MRAPTRTTLIEAFDAAIKAVEPGPAVARHLAAVRGTVELDGTDIGSFDPDSITVVGVGKAAASMASAVCDITGARSATVATPYRQGSDPRVTEIIGGHPVPDQGSLIAGNRLTDEVRSADPSGLVVAVVSGGGSAAAEVPVEGVSLEDLQALNNWLLRSGLSIVEMNEVRAAVSQLKAGGLASMTKAAVITLVLSDVVGAGPHLVASGPTVPSSLGARARSIVAEHQDSGDLPGAIVAAVRNVTPVPSGPEGQVCVIGDPAVAAREASRHLAALGFDTAIATTSMGGESRLVVAELLNASKPGVVWVASGETTVTVSGSGVGGRNQEAALAAMQPLSNTDGVFAALGTDGIDGPTDAAGAVVDGSSLGQAISAGWDVPMELENNNSNPVLDDIGALVMTGPTGTNVCDLWMWFR